MYSFSMITQIFIPSYFGSTVYIKTEKLCYNIFESNWTPTSLKYKRSMQILVERTLRPITIYAAGIFELNLTTLLKVNQSLSFKKFSYFFNFPSVFLLFQILKTAYSVFAMLKNVEN